MSEGILLFTDFHANLWSEFSKPTEEYVNDRFKFQIDTLNKMLRDAQDKNLDVLFAGDLFHKRGAVDVRVYNAVFQTFARYTGSRKNNRTAITIETATLKYII